MSSSSLLFPLPHPGADPDAMDMPNWKKIIIVSVNEINYVITRILTTQARPHYLELYLKMHQQHPRKPTSSY